MKESDLYPPLKRFLEARGWEVKGEVEDCDVVAVREGAEPLVIELKLSLNLGVILQAVDRLTVADDVYVGVPESLALLKKQRKRVLRLLRMLGLGLVTIEPDKGRVAVVLDPGPYTGPRRSKNKRQRLLSEFHRRVGDPNAGGSDTRRGRMTAYRQRAIALAVHLRDHGPTKASVVKQALDEPKARQIMYSNVYGWFEAQGRGVYELSPKGRKELVMWLSSEATTGQSA
jgi:hypothetical protein